VVNVFAINKNNVGSNFTDIIVHFVDADAGIWMDSWNGGGKQWIGSMEDKLQDGEKGKKE
jgi:hypothetical protein